MKGSRLPESAREERHSPEPIAVSTAGIKRDQGYCYEALDAQELWSKVIGRPARVYLCDLTSDDDRTAQRSPRHVDYTAARRCARSSLSAEERARYGKEALR